MSLTATDTRTIDAATEYLLPNGAILHRGGRIRVPKEIPWMIPQEDVRRMDLRLEDGAKSPGSEVLVWPVFGAVSRPSPASSVNVADLPTV